MTTTPIDTQVREDLEKSVTTTKFNDHPCVWIPPTGTADYIVKLRAADRAYLAGEIEKLKGVDVTDSNPMISRGVVLAIINTTQK